MRPRIADEIHKLRRQIEHHDRQYYQASKPEITDTKYDELMQRLRKLEDDNPMFFDPNSPTQRVGGTTVDYLVNLPHRTPMKSIDNAFDTEALTQWHEGNVAKLTDVFAGPLHYAVEWKIDGCALAVRYESGQLTLGMTRGDGVKGDDVTHNARTIRSLPTRLAVPETSGVPSFLEVRGEVFMTHANFMAFQEWEREASGTTPSNPRNTASGAIRLLSSAECARRHLSFYAHGIGDAAPASYGFNTHGDYLQWLESCGIPTIPNTGYGLVFEDALTYIEDMITIMPGLDFPVDGIVLKVDQRPAAMVLGEGNKHSNWQRAYKWKKLEGITTLLDIVIQVGKTGALTPVAILQPVEIGEEVKTTISRATIYNADEIQRLDLRIGDRVVVEKCGEIIPRIVRVETAERVSAEVPLVAFEFPSICPVCGHAAVRDDDGATIRCSNSTSCPAQLHATLCAFVSKKCMDIRQCGPKMLQNLMDAKLIANVADLYYLEERVDELLQVPKVGETKKNKLLDSIRSSKARPLECLLAGLNIRGVGLTVSRTLVERYGTLLAVMSATDESLLELEGVGPSVVASLRTFFLKDDTLALLRRLLDAGVNPGTPVMEGARPTGTLAGKTVVVTGELNNYDREGAKEAIRLAGGRATSSVSGKTSFIVAGREPGAKKIEKAGVLSIPVIDEAEFIKRLTPDE
jgi:DNA ligase (NAD+)